MQVEIDDGYKDIRELENFSVFVFPENGKVYMKISQSQAVGLEDKMVRGFNRCDGVIPYKIEKIVLR